MSVTSFVSSQPGNQLRQAKQGRSLYPFFSLFMATPRKEDMPIREGASQTWFGLKTYLASDVFLVKTLGWVTVVSLSIALVLVSCLAVLRLSALWDLWFEEIRTSDQEGGVQRFLRILTAWLMIVGFITWAFCKIFPSS